MLFCSDKDIHLLQCLRQIYEIAKDNLFVVYKLQYPLVYPIGGM